MRRLLLISLAAIVLIFVTTATWLATHWFFTSVNNTSQPVTFIVPKGASIKHIARDLEAQGMIQHAEYFLLLTTWRGQLSQIKAGEYRIDPGMTAQHLLHKLVKGEVVLHKITFPEGWTFQQMLNQLNNEPVLVHALKDKTPAQIMVALGHSDQPPEGMFYPDTYVFTWGIEDKQILQQAYELAQKKLQPLWENRDSNLPYKTPYDALIVASLVEREAAVPAERPQVAGVILHRLRLGMRLQIDAAVIYGTGDPNKRGLTRADLATDTPYNLYLRSGLPPTPIAMPSVSSINAALHPVMNKALYYVAKGDGSHVFSDTLEQHNAAVRQYRKYQAAQPKPQT